MSEDGFTVKNLDVWLDWLEGLEAKGRDNLKSRILRSIAYRALAYTTDLTPRRSGRLQNSFSVGDRDNVFTMKIGKSSYIVFGTNVEYAEVVEIGITSAGVSKNRGRFIPGFWQNGIFHYVKDYKVNGKLTGMVLKGTIVEGRHMMQGGLDRVEADVDKIAEFEFKRLYAGLVK